VPAWLARRARFIGGSFGASSDVTTHTNIAARIVATRECSDLMLHQLASRARPLAPAAA
jgi:hypothetical protein